MAKNLLNTDLTISLPVDVCIDELERLALTSDEQKQRFAHARGLRELDDVHHWMLGVGERFERAVLAAARTAAGAQQEDLGRPLAAVREIYTRLGLKDDLPTDDSKLTRLLGPILERLAREISNRTHSGLELAPAMNADVPTGSQSKVTATPESGPACAIFWDHSNIAIGARNYSAFRRDTISPASVRLHNRSVWELAHAKRPVSKAVCVGTGEALMAGVSASLLDTGVSVEIYDRGAHNHLENAVDQALQVHMLRAVTDQPPGVAVLLSGDGAGSFLGHGFLADLQRLRKAGWAIEVLSWDGSCNRHLKAWAQENGLYLPLEHFYESITYEKGVRQQAPLSMKRRSRVTPMIPTPPLSQPA